jgi:hypothetical protein
MKEPLLIRLLDAVWEGQWTTRWAAENTTCSWGCGHSFEDQGAHFGGCGFLRLWDDLDNVRRRVGDRREPSRAP